MFRRRKEEIEFIDINLLPEKEKKIFLPISLTGFKKEQLIFYFLSLLSFISIFITKAILENILENKKKELIYLNKALIRENYKIKHLKHQLVDAEERFKNFYIPSLKEKLFVIFYHKWYEEKVIPTLINFQKRVGNFLPYLGYVIYPNPLVDKGKVITAQNLPNGKVIKKPIERNPFSSPQSLPYVELPTYFLNLHFPSVEDKRFLKIVNSLHSSQIKDNLLLEYLLLNTPISKIKYSATNLVLIPINIALTDEINSSRIFQILKRNCNIIIVNKEVKEKFFYKNKWRFNTTFEGICVKYIY